MINTYIISMVSSETVGVGASFGVMPIIAELEGEYKIGQKIKFPGDDQVFKIDAIRVDEVEEKEETVRSFKLPKGINFSGFNLKETLAKAESAA